MFTSISLVFLLSCSCSMYSNAQGSYCDSLQVLFESANYELAHRLLLENETTQGLNCRLTEAKAWLASGFLLQAKASALAISDLRQVPAGDSLLARIDELLQQKDDETSLLEIDARYSSLKDDTPAGFLGSALQVFRDTSWQTSNFPLRSQTNTRNWPVAHDSINRSINRILEDVHLDYIGRFAIYQDKWLMLTCAERLPYGKGPKSGRFIIKAFDMITGIEKPEFTLSAGDCDYAQPVFHANQLYFASNCPGAQGGYDIWTCELLENGLGKPTNLGPHVNSNWNEGYPCFMGDTLIFTSDRADRGYGGLDLYFALDFDRPATNIGRTVNSAFDEFGMLNAGGKEAFLASNRPNGKGGFDIYTYQQKGGIYFPSLIGRLEPQRDGMLGKEVLLTDRISNTVYRTLLDSKGYFTFHHVKGLVSYELSFSDLTLNKGDKVKLYDGTGSLLMELNYTDPSSFIFELLTPLDYVLPAIPNGDESILSIDFSGETTRENDRPSGIVIFLEDGNGELIGATHTDEQGNFSFQHIKPDSRYIIRTEIIDPKLTIHILDNQGKIIQSISPQDGNGYVYVRIGSDKDVITLTNEASQEVKVSMEEVFTLPVINYELDKTTLSETSRKNLLAVAKILKENLEIDIILTGHTDSRGSAAYNMQLSQKRIESVINWLKLNGVSSDRMSGKGYGESKPLNNCIDGTGCTEAEHALNRRTELQFQRREKISINQSRIASPP